MFLLPRRHQRGDGQLRVHAGAVSRRGGGAGIPQSRAGRGHLPGVNAGGHQVELGDLPRISRYARRPAEGHQLCWIHRPLGASHLCDGRTRVHRAGDRRRARRHGPQRAGGRARRRDRILDIAHPHAFHRQAGGQRHRRMERGSHHCQRHERHWRRCLRAGRGANLSGSRVERRLLRSPTAARRRIRRALYMGAHQRPGRAPGLAYLPPAPGRYGRRRRAHVRPGALSFIESAPELRVTHAIRRLGSLAGDPGAAARRAEGQAQGSGHQGQARRHRHGPR